MRTAPKKSTPPVAPFKVGDRVTCVRGFERSAVLTGTRWTVTSVGKTTIGIAAEHIAARHAPGVWPAVRFALAPYVKAEDEVLVWPVRAPASETHPLTYCPMCGREAPQHDSWCDWAGL